jgi:hypothetical protein
VTTESEHTPVPPITGQMRQQARETPDSWLYVMDPGYADFGDDVPPEGIIGAYYIDSHGEIEENFQFNDEYRPSDLEFALPEATNELERVLNRVATGEAPDSDLPPAVLDAELLLYAPNDEDPSIYAAEMSDGSQLVPACSSVTHVPASWPSYRKVTGRALLELLNGLDLGLNLDNDVRAVIPHELLIETARER